MTLPAPRLDDRRFQQLVDEAKLRVQERCPEWTDHNVSDPGVVLIEAFAEMVDQVIYRLNQVPDHLYRRFLALIGVTPHPPRAASTEITFRLAAPQPEPVNVPRDTQVATKREENRPAIGFTLVEELTIAPCRLAAVGVAGQGGEVADKTADASAGTAFAAFSEPPRPGDALHVDLTAAVPRCAVEIALDCDEAYGHNVDPRRPPLGWEAWDGRAWLKADFEDGTQGLNRTGKVVVHVPREAGAGGATRLRCRVIAGDMPAYEESPRIGAVTAVTIGGTARAVHGEAVRDELLGTSTGQPSQRFSVQRPPVVSQEPIVVECRYPDGSTEEYVRVDGFADSDKDAPHFTLDPSDGEIVLGPAVRDADPGGGNERDTKEEGRPRQHGKVPPRGSRLVVRGYLTGGGPEGNVARGQVQILKGTIPLVASVTNRRPATGGAPAETVPEAYARGPLEFARRERAVTPGDYERYAIDASDEVARARCVPPPLDEPGAPATVVVVPAITPSRDAPAPEALRTTSDAKESVRAAIEARRVLGARFEVKDAEYQAVRVDALVRVLPGRDEDDVREACRAALHRFFHPTSGGPEGRGWPWGRAIYSGMAYVVLERVPGVEIVQELRLFMTPLEGDETGQPRERIELPPDTLVVSREHNVAAVAGEERE